MTGIIIAFPKMENGTNIKNILLRSGYQIMNVCSSGAQVLQEAHSLQEGIVVCGYRLTDMMYWELRDYLPEGFDMLLISSKDMVEDKTGDDGLCPGTAKEETEIQAEKTDNRGAGAHRPGQGNPGGTKRHDRRGSPSLSAKMQYGRRQYSSGNRTDDPEHAGYLSLLRSLRLDGTVSGSISG